MAEISDKALKNNYALNKLKLKATALNSSTQYSDESQFQTGATSYGHAMRNRDVGQTVDQAKGLADAFVRKQFDLAKQLLSAGNIKEAYYQFGIGLHTLQDATSPAHGGFQPWGDHVSPGELVTHIAKELNYPGMKSNLQRVTNQYLDWFENSNQPLPKENLFNNIKHD